MAIGWASPSRAADAPPASSPAAAPAISFDKDIRPILQVNCQGCHQPAKAEGKLVLTTHAGLLKAGETGEVAVVPGNPDGGALIKQITPRDGKAEMPKGKPPLSADEIERIRRWIAAGAPDDTPPALGDRFSLDNPPVYRAAPLITALDFSPDDSLLAISGYHEVLLYSGDGSQLVGRLIGQSQRIESAVFSPDGKSLAVAGGSPGRLGELQVWDVESRKLRYALAVTYDTLYGASWSHDSSKIAFGCADNTIRAIDAATGKQVLFQGAHNDWVLDTVFSKDSSHLISVSRDRSMKLVEVATERFVDNITSITPGALKGGLAAVDRNPKNDELLVGGADGTPKIYQMFRTRARVIGDDFNLLKSFEPLEGRIYDVAFSPDGEKIAVGSSSDGAGEVRIDDVATAKPLHKFTGQGPVFCVAFSSDGKRLASGGFAGLVRIHDVASGQLIKEFNPAPVAVAAQ
jgi:WD40 repeat protein/mono/diheme cytochrome c family protein